MQDPSLSLLRIIRCERSLLLLRSRCKNAPRFSQWPKYISLQLGEGLLPKKVPLSFLKILGCFKAFEITGIGSSLILNLFFQRTRTDGSQKFNWLHNPGGNLLQHWRFYKITKPFSEPHKKETKRKKMKGTKCFFQN